MYLMWLHRGGVKGWLTSAERGTAPVLQTFQATVMLFLAFPFGVRFLKVHEGFIPFHAPRELSIAMKEMQEVGRISGGQAKKSAPFKGKFFGNALWVLLVTREMFDLFDSSHLLLRHHIYTRLGAREGNNTLPKDLWLSSLSPGPSGATVAEKQIGSAFPKELRAVRLFPSFSPRIFLFSV